MSGQGTTNAGSYFTISSLVAFQCWLKCKSRDKKSWSKMRIISSPAFYDLKPLQFESLVKGQPQRLSFSSPRIMRDEINIRSKTKEGSLYAIYSHLDLLDIELDLSQILIGEGKTFSQNYIKVHSFLKNGMNNSFSDTLFDFVLIDCPPNFSITTKNAIVASDYILIPAKPDDLSTMGIPTLERNVKKLQNDFNKHLEIIKTSHSPINPIHMVLFNMVQLHRGKPVNIHQQYISKVKRVTSSNITILNSTIRHNNIVFADAPEHRTPVALQKSTSSVHKEVTKDLESVVRELMGITH